MQKHNLRIWSYYLLLLPWPRESDGGFIFLNYDFSLIDQALLLLKVENYYKITRSLWRLEKRAG